MSPTNAALVLIEVLLAFHDEKWGDRNNPNAETNVARLLNAWRRTGRPVHQVHHASFSIEGRFYPGTLGYVPLPEARPAAHEPVHVKTVNSAFIGTCLESDLRKAGVSTLVFARLTTNHCVSTSLRMAANHGFTCYLVEDATAALEGRSLDGSARLLADVHQAAFSDLSGEFAPIVDTQSLLKMLAVKHRSSGPPPQQCL